MKFPVINLQQKFLFFLLLAIPTIVILVFVGLFAVLGIDWSQVVNGMGETPIWALILIPIILIIGVFGIIIAIHLICTHVEINDNGIELHIGKLVLNKILWADVSRVEIFCEENIYIRRFHISVLKSNRGKYKQVRHFFFQNMTRGKITFCYDKQAIELIQQHFNLYIDGHELIYEQ